MLRAVFALSCFFLALNSTGASAWGYQGHKVVGAIADKLLKPSAREHVREILGEHLNLQIVAPWADCVRSVVRFDDGSFEYEVNPDHFDFEVPCTPFRSVQERAAMVDYARRNWFNCDDRADGPDKPPAACHTTYHFDSVAIQRNGFDRAFQGTNEHDLVAAIGAAVAVLRGEPMPTGFAFSFTRREALFLLAHFVGDLHQPLHVGSVYLDGDGKLVDPDVIHEVDPATQTTGGNSIQDQNINLHHEWDDIPTDIGEGSTRELRDMAERVPASQGRIEDWPAAWASDSIIVARDAFAGVSFARTRPPPRPEWNVTFDDHTAYVFRMDQIKRKQLAKGGARLAEILNTIWP
jgi:hypothetical protein